MAKKHRDEPESEFLEPTPIPEVAIPDPVPETGDALSLAAGVPNLPEPPKPLISLRVFSAMTGVRWDQAAGFLSYAKMKKMGPLTMEEWQAEFQKFNNRPV